MPIGQYNRKLFKHNCKVCAKEFYNKAVNSKYCSKVCLKSIHTYKNIRGTIKKCGHCGQEFNAKQKNIRFCSVSCSTKSSFDKRRHHLNKLIKKECLVCSQIVPMRNNQKYCSDMCKGKIQYFEHGRNTTNNQYNRISGNWDKYFVRLANQHNRRRDGLTSEILKTIYNSQQGKCALTGELLTCTLKKGEKCWTNASVDRINAGGLYSKENIQLVCAAVNIFRNNMKLSEFISWCTKVHNYNQ